MKKVIPLLFSLAMISGCGTPGLGVAADNQVQAPQAGLPGVVSFGAQQKATVNPSISRDFVEATVRQKLKNSEIQSFDLSLKTVSELDAAVRGDVPTLTADSNVWVATAQGNLKTPYGPVPKPASKAVFLVSTEDGHILSSISYK